MKRIVTAQDVTCLGSCALTVALPVVSAMGVEASVLPTALLSVHTAFPTFTFQDLTSALPPVIEHWKREGFAFDAIYTGYLGSLDQVDLISRFIDDFRGPETLVFLDPVLGDAGKLYEGFDTDFAHAMARLCAKADVIVPNLTEACLLLDRPYPEGTCDEDYVRGLLRELSGLGVPRVVLTGVDFRPDQVGVMAYDAGTGEFFQYFSRKYPRRFHGTGDVFASTCVGALTRGFSLERALTLAVDFTLESIEKTLADPEGRWYSVNFQEAIPMLVSRLESE
ncbi:MAG: putative rane protein [Firmicutes bacterium]|nr:putative rane protein [Bacillota bacterium]